MQSKYKVSLQRTSSGYFSNHSLTFLTTHFTSSAYLYCIIVICAEVFVAVTQIISFSREQCIFQGSGLTSTILCKSIIHYQTLKVQSRKLKKLQRAKKGGFSLILCLFLHDTFSKIERDGKLFRKRCQNFTSRILSRWLYEDITCSGLLINKKQKAAYT